MHTVSMVLIGMVMGGFAALHDIGVFGTIVLVALAVTAWRIGVSEGRIDAYNKVSRRLNEEN